jgi:RNA polymerase sigma factor (sigma-70 family)
MSADDDEIYAKCSDELVRFATLLVGPWCAEDVVAEAVTRALSSPGWRAVEHPRAYLFRATLNEARQVWRAERRRIRREHSAHSDVIHSETEVRVEVLAALQRLGMRQRAVVFFTYWQDLEADEVALLLGISKRTVQRELTAARRSLEVLLK